MNILLINIHGLLRGTDWEIGRNSDNGGQIVYVMELAKVLAERDDITRVQILSRRIEDADYDTIYAQELEEVSPKFDIVRMPCGPKRYLFKEELWPHLDDLVTNALNYFKRNKLQYDFIYGHYADSGYVASQLSQYLNRPFAFAGHSLGRLKLRNLISSGMPAEQVEKLYSISERIEAEEIAISNAEFVVTSTRFEIGFWEEYHNQHLTEFSIIPPGFNLERFFPYHDMALELPHVSMEDRMAAHYIKEHIERFLSNPNKPMILLVCRPTQTKNIEGVLRMYGLSKDLQALANLVIFSGIRDDIETMQPVEKEVLTNILLLMDKYNLYGKLAIPKKHNADKDIPAAYRYCASMKGVFLNAALMENFGLTALEASACGCPIVVTNAGGPGEIVDNCENGFSCDPLKPEEFEAALRKIFVDSDLWQTLSENGILKVRQKYTWQQHTDKLVKRIELNLRNSTGLGIKGTGRQKPLFDRLARVQKMLVTDIDGTLICKETKHAGLEELRAILKQRKDDFAFVLSTGRNLELIRRVIHEQDLPEPDIIISSVGSQIYYGTEPAFPDTGWSEFIDNRFDRAQIQACLLKLPYLRLQDEASQNPFKISFDCSSVEVYRSDDVKRVLGKYARNVNIIWSHGSFLDILPRRASKGRAMRYLAFKWNIQLGKSIAAGDSGNDMDMLLGNAMSVVVANHSSELEDLRGKRNVFFAQEKGPAGILEGFKHFNFCNHLLTKH